MYVQIERTLGKNLMKMRDTTADELYSQLSANKMLVCTHTLSYEYMHTIHDYTI